MGISLIFGRALSRDTVTLKGDLTFRATAFRLQCHACKVINKNDSSLLVGRFGWFYPRKPWTERQKAGLGARRYTTSSSKNGLIRWQYACDFFSLPLIEAGERLLLIVNLIHIRFAFACNFLYICIGGKSQEAFSFFVVWGRKGVSMAGTGFQYGRYNASICVVLQCKVADIAWQDE